MEENSMNSTSHIVTALYHYALSLIILDGEQWGLVI